MKKSHLSDLPDQWLADLFKGLSAKPLLPGQVYEMDVFHDERCPLLVHSGPCSCNPDIEIRDATRLQSSPGGKKEGH